MSLTIKEIENHLDDISGVLNITKDKCNLLDEEKINVIKRVLNLIPNDHLRTNFKIKQSDGTLEEKIDLLTIIDLYFYQGIKLKDITDEIIIEEDGIKALYLIEHLSSIIAMLKNKKNSGPYSAKNLSINGNKGNVLDKKS